MYNPPDVKLETRNVSTAYRPDIDGLRAVAILSVILFHAFPSVLQGGFVGVDIFFVISGFLISSIIFKSLQRGSFSFSSFYSHRIKRIFPALIFVLVVSYVVGWFILFPNEFKQLGGHIVASASFFQNFNLAREDVYFGTAAELKPLLHLWSLAVEEQFYLVYPVLIFLAWRIGVNVLAVVLLLGVVSFGINLHYVTAKPSIAFFLPQARIWELLVGSLLAYLQVFNTSRLSIWMQLAGRGGAINNILSATGAVLIVAGILFINKSKAFPGWWALLPVWGTFLLLLAGPQTWVNRVLLSNKLMVFVGLVSYPLYLWHWPILTFARLVWSEVPPVGIRIAALVMSFVLAWLTYRFLEKPVRFGNTSGRVTFFLAVALFVVGCVGFGASKNGGLEFREFAQLKQNVSKNLNWGGQWIDASCFDKYQVAPCVGNGESPDVIIIGDSHANHIYPGLASFGDHTLLNTGTCSPLEGIEAERPAGAPKPECRAREHLERNLKLARDIPTLKTAVISGWWWPVLSGTYLNPEAVRLNGSVRLYSTNPSETGLSNPELVRAGLSRTIDSLEESGLGVVFVRDTPAITSELLEYCKLRSRAMPGNCTIPKSDYMQMRKLEDGLVEYLQGKYPYLSVVDPINQFCDDAQCFIMRDGVLFYRDDHHLSIDGSHLLAPAIESYLKPAGGNMTSSVQ